MDVDTHKARVQVDADASTDASDASADDESKGATVINNYYINVYEGEWWKILIDVDLTCLPRFIAIQI